MATRFDLKDAAFGAFLIAVSLLVFWATRNLTFGSPSDMGPGFMPRALAGMAMAFGLFFAARGLTCGGEAIEAPQVRPLACLVAAIAAFALLGLKAGLFVAAVATVVVAALGSRETKPFEIAAFAVAIAAASTVLFVKLLSLPIPIGPW